MDPILSALAFSLPIALGACAAAVYQHMRRVRAERAERERLAARNAELTTSRRAAAHPVVAARVVVAVGADTVQASNQASAADSAILPARDAAAARRGKPGARQTPARDAATEPATKPGIARSRCCPQVRPPT